MVEACRKASDMHEGGVGHVVETHRKNNDTYLWFETCRKASDMHKES